MAVVIPFEDLVHARRRQEEQATAERCVALIESALHLTLHLLNVAAPEDRPCYARRIRQLSELLEYAVQAL